MFGLLNPEFYLYFVWFFVAVTISWFIPGFIALSIIKLKNISLKFLLAFPVGMSLWGLQGYLFGYAQLRFLTYLYILVFVALFAKTQKESGFAEVKSFWKKVTKQPKWLLFLILASSFLQIYSHIGSGLLNSEGLPFYFVNSVDGVLHLSYIQEIAQQFPPQEPGAVGLPLQNYHYWSDLVQAELVRVWQLPTIHIFFQYAPTLISILTTVLFLQFIAYLGGSRKAQLVALFLLTFGGDAAYLITQVLHRNWGVNVSSLDSGVTFYFNIPQVYARFVFLSILFLFLKWWKEKSLKLGILLAILTASLFGFKVYYALYTVFGVCFFIGIQMIFDFIQKLKKHSPVKAFLETIEYSQKSILFVVILATISLLVYLPVNKAAGGLTYSFFEWPHLLLSAVNIDYIDWFLRMQVYEAYGNTRNIIIFNLWAAFLTFVAVYGTRMIGMIPPITTKNENLKQLLWFFIPANILFVLLGLFTLQTSGGLNIFNFLIVPIFSFNIFTALYFDNLKTKLFIPVFILFALLTIPRSFLQLSLFYQRYQTQNTDALITNDELEAYEYLRAQNNIVVQKTMEEHYNYQTTYVAFMSGQPTYIGGISMLESHNQPTEERLQNVMNALSSTDVNQKANMLNSYGITHFIIPTEEFKIQNSWFAKPVFQNDSWTVLDLRNE